MPIEREKVLEIMREILARQGKSAALRDDQALREIGFRSLDFSELALRLEAVAGHELDFDGVALRGIRTVADVVAFFSTAFAEHASEA